MRIRREKLPWRPGGGVGLAVYKKGQHLTNNADCHLLRFRLIKNKLTKLIEKHQDRATDEARNYIGASSIGSDCFRQIWYQFKGFESSGVSSKIRRTWSIGKHLEGLILDWLEDAGIEVARLWYDLSAENQPYFQGHLDSVWTKKGEPFAIIEIKTAKNSSFNIFVNKGLKVWNPQYYAQIQAYMGMSGIFSAYILVLNKDNSDLSDELVLFDSGYYEKLKEKAAMIYGATVTPPRIHGSPLYFKCKMCNFNKGCHK